MRRYNIILIVPVMIVWCLLILMMDSVSIAQNLTIDTGLSNTREDLHRQGVDADSSFGGLFDPSTVAPTGNPVVRPFDPDRPVILSDMEYIGKEQYGKSKGRYVGKRYMNIQYPWNRISNASIEIRVLDAKVKEKPQWCVPVMFRSTYEPLDSINQVMYRLRLGTSDASDAKYFDEEYLQANLLPPADLSLWTFSNQVGTEGLLVHCVRKNDNTKELETTLIYPDLEQWSANDNNLFLDLNGEEFKQDVDLRVWLLKGDKIIWTEDFRWPGSRK